MQMSFFPPVLASALLNNSAAVLALHRHGNQPLCSSSTTETRLPQDCELWIERHSVKTASFPCLLFLSSACFKPLVVPSSSSISCSSSSPSPAGRWEMSRTRQRNHTQTVDAKSVLFLPDYYLIDFILDTHFQSSSTDRFWLPCLVWSHFHPEIFT